MVVKKPIRNYGKYLATTLNDLVTPKNVTNQINKIVTEDKKKSSFNNFTQREYDYNKLEKQLLGWEY